MERIVRQVGYLQGL